MNQAIRIIVILIGLVAMGGFGFCGLLGIALGASEGATIPWMVALGVSGLLVAGLIGWGLVHLVRKGKKT